MKVRQLPLVRFVLLLDPHLILALKIASSTMPNDSSRWRPLDPYRNIATRLMLISAGGAVALSLLAAAVSGDFCRRLLEERAATEFKNYAQWTGLAFDLNKAAEFRAVQTAATQEVFSSPAATVEDRRRALDKLVPAFAWAAFIDPAGVVTAASEGLLEGTRVSEQDWFRKGSVAAHRGGVQAVPPLAEALGSNVKFIAYAVPIKNSGGQLLGVLGVQQYWSFDVRHSALPANAAKQQMVASFYLRPPQVIWLLDSGGTGGVKHLRAPVVHGAQGSGRDHLNGRDFIVGYALNTDAEWPILVAVRQPVEVVDAPARTLQVRIIEIGFAAGALLALPSYLAGRRLNRKLQFMAAAAERIGSGDPLSVMPRFQPDDQLAATTESIARMVEALRSREESMGRPKPGHGSRT